MTVWLAPLQIAAVLLALGGVAKLRDPGDTARALRAAHLPGATGLVRGLAAAEVAVAVWALATGDVVPVALVGLSYLAFAAFVVNARRRALPIASCGCFGQADTPPTSVHIALNVGAAIAAVGVVARGGAGFVDVLRAQPLGGLPYALLLSIGVWFAFLALTSLATLGAGSRS